MPVTRLSVAVAVYVTVALFQLVAVLVIGGGSLTVPGLLVAVLLFGGLAAGRPAAWWILLAMNTVGLAAILAIVVGATGRVLWANVVVLAVTGVAMEAVLLSAPMRRHVASRGLRLRARSGVGHPRRWRRLVGR
ncbi:hypothetical protein [Conexibacter sp. DBS9H8]|uniref:hypothetical protein n=1 Tax=Conexibacter sp. DBS9H8 TaxID=2937801 RepID=UPI00200DDCEE|nr:hypothetical protein [Conexibacter sp. DBS9H8]